MKTLIFTLALSLCGVLNAQEYYEVPTKLYISKAGDVLVDIEGHYYEVQFTDHSDKCPCMRYIIDPSTRAELLNL